MRTAILLTCWTLTAIGVGYILFAPDNGLLHSGPWATVGLTLIGLGLCRHAQCVNQAPAADNTTHSRGAEE